MTARAGGQPPVLYTYCNQLRLLLGSQISPGMHKAAQLPPCHAGSGSILPQQQQQQRALFHWMPLPCSESRYRRHRATVLKQQVRSQHSEEETMNRQLQLFLNTLSGLLPKHQNSYLTPPLLLWPHGCCTAQTTACVCTLCHNVTLPQQASLLCWHKSHNSRRRPIFTT